MASYLKALNLTNGVEEVNTAIEVAGGDLIAETLTAQSSVTVGDGFDGALILTNTTPNQVNISYSTNSTEDLTFNIKNTKATLDAGDILIYNGAEFEVDNISDVIVKNNKSFKNVFLLGGM